MQSQRLTVPRQLDDYRLDIALVNMNLGLSRRKIREIIDVGGVYVNDKRIRIASRKVQAGNNIRLEYDLESIKKIKRQSFELTDAQIIFDGEQYAIINKPPGLASQATRDQSIEHVVPVLEKFYKKRDGSKQKLILVHRLDKETSGLLIVAKDEKTATYFTDCFKQNTIKKEYHALVRGIPEQPTFEESCFLSSIQPKSGLVKKVRAGGKHSHTKFRLLHKNDAEGVSLMACYPTTGRSHQIRVHLALHNLPILGDKKYFGQHKAKISDELYQLSSEHHFLHAYKLCFVDPQTEKGVEYTAEYPVNFRKAVGVCEDLSLTLSHNLSG